MSALLTLFGDLGGMAGPTIVGCFSSSFGDKLQIGLLAATLSPLVLLISLIALKIHESGGEKRGK